MDRSVSAGRRLAAALLVVILTGGAEGQGQAQAQGTAPAAKPAAGFDLDALTIQARRIGNVALARYERTPPADRVTWGGLAASALLGGWVVLERMARLRRRSIIPDEFSNRFLARLKDGKLDRGKALDFCELNPSPAARVALAGVRRWGRPSTDLERATTLVQRVEADRLRRNVGTLRRIAALTPLLGLLGTLIATGRVLENAGAGASWGPGLAAALNPLTAGVALAILALVAYDGLAGRVDRLAGSLDRIGAETIDAIAMATPLPPEPQTRLPISAVVVPANPGRTPHTPSHPIRMEVPYPTSRPIDDEDDFN